MEINCTTPFKYAVYMTQSKISFTLSFWGSNIILEGEVSCTLTGSLVSGTITLLGNNITLSGLTNGKISLTHCYSWTPIFLQIGNYQIKVSDWEYNSQKQLYEINKNDWQSVSTNTKIVLFPSDGQAWYFLRVVDPQEYNFEEYDSSKEYPVELYPYYKTDADGVYYLNTGNIPENATVLHVLSSFYYGNDIHFEDYALRLTDENVSDNNPSQIDTIYSKFPRYGINNKSIRLISNPNKATWTEEQRNYDDCKHHINLDTYSTPTLLIEDTMLKKSILSFYPFFNVDNGIPLNSCYWVNEYILFYLDQYYLLSRTHQVEIYCRSAVYPSEVDNHIPHARVQTDWGYNCGLNSWSQPNDPMRIEILDGTVINFDTNISYYSCILDRHIGLTTMQDARWKSLATNTITRTVNVKLELFENNEHSSIVARVRSFDVYSDYAHLQLNFNFNQLQLPETLLNYYNKTTVTEDSFIPTGNGYLFEDHSWNWSKQFLTRPLMGTNIGYQYIWTGPASSTNQQALIINYMLDTTGYGLLPTQTTSTNYSFLEDSSFILGSFPSSSTTSGKSYYDVKGDVLTYLRFGMMLNGDKTNFGYINTGTTQSYGVAIIATKQ